MNKKTEIENIEHENQNITNITPDSIIVRKITISAEVNKKILMLAAKYHSDLIFKKKDELYNKLFEDAINYIYDNKFLKDLK